MSAARTRASTRCIWRLRIGSCLQSAHAFSSRLSSLRKRQSVPLAMIWFGLDLIMSTSWSRNATKRSESFRVELAPAIVGQLPEPLECEIVSLCQTGIDQPACGRLRLRRSISAVLRMARR